MRPIPNYDPSLDDEPSAHAGTSWGPVDLGPVLLGSFEVPRPTVLEVEGGGALLYEGGINSRHGDSGIGKSWLVAYTIRQLAARGRRSLLIDLEDTAATLVTRLRLLGMTDGDIAHHVRYIRPQEPATWPTLDWLAGYVHEQEVAYCAIDSVGEVFALHGLDENSDADVGPWFRGLPRVLAEAGCCVDLLDHATKAADNPLHPSGSKRKRAAVTGASYLVEVVSPLARAEGPDPVTGRLRLTCAKDRHGAWRRGEVVAHFELTSWPDGGVTAHLWPVPPAGANAQPLPVVLAAKAAVRAAKERGKPVSSRMLEELMQVKARATTRRAGIEYAVQAGSLRVERGARGAQLHVYVCDLPDGDGA